MAGRPALTVAAAGLWRERQANEARGRETVRAGDTPERVYEGGRCEIELVTRQERQPALTLMRPRRPSPSPR